MLHENLYLLRCQHIRIPDSSTAVNMDNLNDYNSSIYYFSNEIILHPRMVSDCVVFCSCEPLCLLSPSTFIYNSPSYPDDGSNDVPNNELYRLLGKRC